MKPLAKDDEYFVVLCKTPQEMKTVYNYFGYTIGSKDRVESYQEYKKDILVGKLKRLKNSSSASIFTDKISISKEYEPYEQITYEQFEIMYLSKKNLNCFEIIKEMNQG